MLDLHNPKMGKLMTIEEFSNGVEKGTFTDSEGWGYWATDTSYDVARDYVKPSRFDPTGAPDWATHIIWLSR